MAAATFDAHGVAEGHTAWETPALRLKSARRRYLWTPRARSAPDRHKFHSAPLRLIIAAIGADGCLLRGALSGTGQTDMFGDWGQANAVH